MDAVKISGRPESPPVADIGFYIDVDGCEVTAAAIGFLLQKLPLRDQWCVEFGAGNDSHGSTTHRLIIGQNYSAILIEGVPEKFRYLVELYKNNTKVTIFEKFVGFHSEDKDCLDRILSATPIPTNFDFLSVDIDGNDYHVWNAIHQYRPKLLMVEFNPTIPAEVDYVQPADPSINFGNSLKALVRLAKSKSYELIAVVGVNAFFAFKDYYELYGITDNGIEALWTKRDCVTYIFSGYDGKIMLGGSQKLPWHYGIPMRESKMQVLPKFLQKYSFNRRDKILFMLLCEPLTFVKKLLTRFQKQ